MNPLLDSDFLVKLNNDKNRTIYARIISLNQYEHPIEQLEGVVTAGSITIDGQSAVRRICSLTLSAKNLNINNVYWGLTTKVKIEIGLQNNIIGYEKYGKIIWFPQGIFILTDFKTTQTINNYTINLTGKDKMCLLNGDVSGNLPAPVRFDSYTDATKQQYILKEEDGGYYNNFIDDISADAILEGFQERYGSDYQFIRGAKRILTLSYIPSTGAINQNAQIRFAQNEDWINLSEIALENTNGIEKIYNINLDDKHIYGFLVKNCSVDDKFIWTIEQKIPITIIIQELLHQFGQERYSNIIIRNIEPYALEMLDSASDNNYYLLHDGTTYVSMISQSELKNNYRIYGKTNKDGSNIITENEDGVINNLIFRNYIDEDDTSLIDILSGSSLEKNIISATQIITKAASQSNKQSIKYTVQPIYPNKTAGYGMTLLVYPDELIGQPGDSITSILDKIVNMLGDYEYFYDLEGQFVFQAKPAYVKTAWNNSIYSNNNNENYIEASELKNKVAYTFDDSALATQYQNTPNMNNIKNDYIIWGEKKNFSGNTIKFHGRYAIENIPLEYTDFNGYTWTSNKQESLMKAIFAKTQSAIGNYKHIYNYPEGFTPEQCGWWEINDWANYYQSIFGIDLSVNSSMMNKYHLEYNDQDSERMTSFQNGYLKTYNGSTSLTNTDVITLIYDDPKTKKSLKNIYCHGSCNHYYSQFMDLRVLNQGWDYTQLQGEYYRNYRIANTWDSNKKYILDNGKTQITWGYHPDYTTSFIYKPILPDDSKIYINDLILSLIYKNAMNENNQIRRYALGYDVDWRHLIHIMADDWYKHHTEDDYEINLRMNNSWPDLNIDLFPYGRTGYEQFYLDFTSIGGFWQDLYNVNYIKYLYYLDHAEIRDDSWDSLQKLYDADKCQLNQFGNIANPITINLQSIEKNTLESYYNINILVSSLKDKNQIEKELEYLSDYVLESTWENNNTSYLLISRISKNINNNQMLKKEKHISILMDIINDKISSTPISNYSINPEKLFGITTVFNNNKKFINNGQYRYWVKDVIEDPSKLTFWFDFFKADEMGIGKFAISVIGDRPKTINDAAIKNIIYEDTPDVIYCSLSEYNTYKIANVLKTGYQYIIIDKDGKGYLPEQIKTSMYKNFPNNIKENFVRSIRTKTVHDQADAMLYQYSYYNDTVNINNVPIYYLQPNTIISTKDELSRVTGYYVINKINISLAYNGIMNITAIKSPERIY